MNEQAHILISGRDSSLVATRGRVLESAGFRVSTTLKPVALFPSLGCIKLLILCHTLSAEERRKDLNVLRELFPEAKVLCLTPHEDALECGTPTLDTFQGPRELVHIAGRLVSA